MRGFSGPANLSPVSRFIFGVTFDDFAQGTLSELQLRIWGRLRFLKLRYGIGRFGLSLQGNPRTKSYGEVKFRSRPSSPRSRPKSLQSRPKGSRRSVQSRAKVGPKLIQSRPKVHPKSVASRPKVVPKSAQTRPKVDQSRPKAGSKFAQSRRKVDPKSAQSRGQKVSFSSSGPVAKILDVADGSALKS